MSLPSFSVQKKVTIWMVTAGILLVGVISFIRLPQELYPPITFPQVTVVTDYANAAPEEIETLITRPIEEAVSSVAGLKRIESISREGRSTVKVAFNWGQDIDFAALAVREKIDLVKERLPKESEDPVVLKYDPLAKPVMIISVSAPELDPIQLKHQAEKMIKDNLEKVEGVASATVSGGLDREILVQVDQGRLEANHLSLLDLIDSIEHANVTYPAGSIKKGLYEYLIRTVGEFRSVKEVEYSVAGVDTVEKVKKEDTSFVERGNRGPRDTVDTLRDEVRRQTLEKRLVLIRDVAEVVDGTSERTSVSRLNGKENISISIQKQANANTIQVVNRLKKALAFLKDDITARGLRYEIIYDHSSFIRQSLENLRSNAVEGGVLVFLGLLFFLRALGPAIIVSLSVPITVLGVFFMMSLTGITLNTMSIGGLVLAIGMITDTSIVVIENIFRRRQGGEDALEAAIKGTEELIWPVVSSNLTTIAVFFPVLVFVPGIPGQIFKDVCWAIIHSQVISTFVPLTFVPMTSLFCKVEKTDYKPIPWTGFLEKRLIGDIPVGRKIRYLLFILAIVIGICSTALVIFPSLEREVLPKVDQGQFTIKVNMPIGTRLEVTDQVCARLEGFMKDIPEIKDVAVTIGSEKTVKGQVKTDTLRASQALVIVTLDQKRKKSSSEIVRILQEKMEGMEREGADIDFVLQESEFSFAEGGAKPIVIEVKGYDFTEMAKWADRLKKQLSEIPGVINIQDDLGKPSPETKLEIDKKRSALYGISALDVSLIAKAALEGVVATQYRETGKEYDIRVRLSEKDRKNVENLNNLLLYSHVLDTLVPLKQVATIETSTGPSEILRADQERTITVSADMHKNAKSNEILSRVRQMLTQLGVDPKSGIAVNFSGKAKEVSENFSKIIFALVLATILNYMIMASQFESFLQPLIIMVTVPLALFGVSVALLVAGKTLNLISFFGMIMLVGTAVNNGIVLIEYINQARERGLDIESAALEAAKIRTRPILVSNVTSVIGLIPLALGLGEGAELRSPMAVAMMGGTISSTILTLVVVPVLYILIARLSERLFSIPEED